MALCLPPGVLQKVIHCMLADRRHSAAKSPGRVAREAVALEKPSLHHRRLEAQKALDDLGPGEVML